ncbi:MAG: hypothetical protein IKA79_04900 [Lentisphaeria bacterium]|nr:hypothetical protein [Lentisphaeria bacterium]
MMMFLKKNILFFSVFTVVFAISLVLLVMDASLYSEILDDQEKITKTNEDYKKEYGAKVKPVRQNAEMINEDTVELKGQVVKLQRRFGAPYRKFLLKFSADTGISEDQIMETFRTHFADYKVKNGDKEETLGEILNRPPYAIKRELNHVFFGFMDAFRDKLAMILTRRAAEEAAKKAQKEFDPESVKEPSAADRDKINKAYDRFFENIISTPQFTVEDLAPLDEIAKRRLRNDIFASALGLPRTQEPLECQTYLLNMQLAFVAKRLIPGVTDIETLRKFTYDQYVNSAPVAQNIPEIYQAMPVFEDIGRRLRNVTSGAIEVTDMSKNGPTPSPVSDKYLRYTFKLKVNCTMESIREFVNKLHAAYVDDRIYAVRWVSLSAGSEGELDELKKILQDNNSSVQNTRTGRRIQNRRNVQREAAGIAPYLDPRDLRYATPIVGKNRSVTAEIDFDYYIYIGERVHTYQVNQH